ncbi:conserved Plasmodium protein, unknown function [Plasmodium gallinaceum]|uniref:Uncharacterized protein n=1 Tax=Plasmodium gallinaceum TaxID=5849 RepID=A0A1J1GS98_PLAGA|nr:conserved Plasmodium protein, unknown function [Plasmodium gallinaceum]CRG95369.1 conserved Plasmodium protein, unknown function [Plasmodium gallinaceum]
MSSNFLNENEDEINNILGEKYRSILKLKASNNIMNSEKLNINHKQTNENDESNNNDSLNKKLNLSGQHKRLYDFYNNKNSFQHYLKKLKTRRIDADGFRNILEKHLAYECENPMFKAFQDEDKKGIGSETNSSSSNHEGLHFYRKINLFNKNRSKSKNKSRKRKRITSKIDKKFIIKCRACKFINSNGFKIEDYYICQNCGDNDFSVIRSSSPNNMSSSMDK